MSSGNAAEEKRMAKESLVIDAAVNKGIKDLAMSIKTVTKLKDSNFQLWRDQMQRVAYSNEWHKSIMESLVDPPVVDSDDDTHKHDADVKHAYLLILHTTDGSALEDVLQPCKRGDARQAYQLVHDHYHRRTLAGEQSAQTVFFNATMANTNTNVSQWMAMNARNAIDLNAHSEEGRQGIIDDKRELLQLISGLLPDFEPVRHHVMFAKGMTLAEVKYKLHDFAVANKLETLTKGGPGSVGKNNVLMVDGKGGGRGKKGGGGAGKGGNAPGPLAPGVIDLTPSKNPTTTGVVDCKNYVNRGWCGYNPCKFNHPPKGGGPPGGASVNMHHSSLPMIDSVFSIDAGPGPVSDGKAAPAEPTPRAAGRRQRKIDDEHRRFRDFNQHEAFAQMPQRRPVGPGPTKPPYYEHIADSIGLADGTCFADYDFDDEWNEAEAVEAESMHAHSVYDSPLHKPKVAAMTVYSLWLLIAMCAAAAANYFMAVFATAISSVLRSGQRFTLHASHGGNFWLLIVSFAVAMYACTAGASFVSPAASVHAHDFIESALFTASDTPTCHEAGYEWCSDSGTNRFVTNDVSDFLPGSVIYEQTVVAVGGGVVTSTQSGTVLVQSNDHNHRIFCENVLFLPQCSKKLMPASSFVRKGCTLAYTDTNKVYLTDKHGNPIFTGKEIDGLYYFNGNTQRNADNATTNEKTTNFSGNTAIPPSTYFGLKPGNITASAQDFPEKLYEAHCAYGHLHFDKLRKLLGLKKGTNPNCEACTTAKSKAEHLTGQTYVRATRPGYRIHMDVGFTSNSDYVFQLYCDDYDRYCYIDMLPSKDQALPCWVNLKHTIENDVYPSKVAIIRTDSEPLYRSAAWVTHTTDNNIEHEFSSRYRHDQNGVIEGKMNPLGATFRAQMFQGSAPACDQPDAMLHSVVILNNSPTKANNGWTPREKRLGMRLPVNTKLLRGPLFCLCFAHVYGDERTKHAPRGVACVYLGYDQVNNTYLVKEWATGQRYYSADVTFHPNTFPYRANPQRTIGTLQQYDDIAPFLTADAGPRVSAVPAPRGKSTRARTNVYAKSGGVDLRDIPDHDSGPDSLVYMLHSFGPDPANMKEALEMWDADNWIAAELEEKNSFKHHDVYEVVLRSSVPNGRRVFKPRPVLTRKINPPDEFHPNGSINKNKFRMTIQAFTKMLKQGIDYEEKHASTVRWNTIKIFMAIAVRFGYDIITTDIKTFFLYGNLTDVIHMEIPEGWGEDGCDGPEYVWRLKKSVYGLPQAGNCAQKDLKQTIGGSGLFNASKADDCVFVTKDHSDGYSACGTFVDDIIIVGEPAGNTKFVSTLESRYDITVNRDPKIFCGVQIERSREHKWLKLHQQAYTVDLLKKYDRTATNSIDTPMDPGTAKHLMMLPTDEATPASIKAYQEIVGALMWLLRTRPDMAYTVNLLSRYLRSATPKHLAIATGRPLKYLANTTNLGIVFSPGGDDDEWKLSASADSDLAGDVNTSKSTSGGAATLGKHGNVSCFSRLDKKISTSTGQAETYAFQDVCKEIVWIRLILHELGYGQSDATECLSDNDGVLSQVTKSVNHATAKHYRIAQAFIRMLFNAKEIKGGRVDSEDNPSDTFTKPLPRAAFQRHRLTIMGPQTKPVSA